MIYNLASGYVCILPPQCSIGTVAVTNMNSANAGAHYLLEQRTVASAI